MACKNSNFHHKQSNLAQMLLKTGETKNRFETQSTDENEEVSSQARERNTTELQLGEESDTKGSGTILIKVFIYIQKAYIEKK